MSADDLVVILRGLLGGLPGVTAMGFQTFNSWLVVVITVSSDEALIALGERLELSRSEVRVTKNQWWRSATSTSEQDMYRVAVSGPRHAGSPPGDDDGGASS